MMREGALARFQASFARALVAGTDPSIASCAAQPGFAVYRNTVMKGCIDALQANYPAVHRLVGDEWFRAAAAVYVRDHLPAAPMLFEYGASFPAFLDTFPPAAELTYLAGVARLDRCWTEAHCAPDAQPLDPVRVARLAPEALGRERLTPHVSARWAWFGDAPIATIWRRNRKEGDFDAEIDWRGEGVLVVRPRAEVETADLDAAGCAFLDACARGDTIAEAAARSLAADPRADLAALMARLLSAGAFERLEPGSVTITTEG